MLSAQFNLSPTDIVKINRKYACKDTKFLKYDKGEKIENAIPW